MVLWDTLPDYEVVSINGIMYIEGEKHIYIIPAKYFYQYVSSIVMVFCDLGKKVNLRLIGPWKRRGKGYFVVMKLGQNKNDWRKISDLKVNINSAQKSIEQYM